MKEEAQKNLVGNPQQMRRLRKRGVKGIILKWSLDIKVAMLGIGYNWLE
jgi:hypothetical protein